MLQKPRKMTDTFLHWKELAISIVQGVIITSGLLFAYQYTVQNGGNEEKTRAVVFTTLIFANILLSYVNRSFYYSVFETFKNRNTLLVVVSLATLVMLFAILFVEPLTDFFQVTTLTWKELAFSSVVATVSVAWFEAYKLIKRKTSL